MPLVMRVARPPAIGSVYTSPSRSNTRVEPSGDTSRFIHVPSEVSKLIVRALASVRPSRRVLSRAGCCADASPAMLPRSATNTAHRPANVALLFIRVLSGYAKPRGMFVRPQAPGNGWQEQRFTTECTELTEVLRQLPGR